MSGEEFAVIDGGGRPDGRKKQPKLEVVEGGLKRRLPPRGLKRDEAADYVGVGATTFDDMIKDGVMPAPWRYRGCVRWDRRKLDAAIDQMDNERDDNDPWARMSL